MLKKVLRISLSVLLVAAVLGGCASIFNAEKPEEENNPAIESVDFSTLTYVALGDSLTYGADGISNKRMESPYPDLVRATLHLKSAQNCGVAGDRVDEIYNRIDTMEIGADIVSFMGGTNDCYQSVPLGTIHDTDMTTFYGRLNLLTKALLERYPDAFLFYMTPFKSARSAMLNGNENGDTLEDFAQAVIDVCAFYDIPCLDIYHLCDFGIEMYLPESDGIHPSQEFVRNYTAPQIATFIKENYK